MFKYGLVSNRENEAINGVVILLILRISTPFMYPISFCPNLFQVSIKIQMDVWAFQNQRRIFLLVS